MAASCLPRFSMAKLFVSSSTRSPLYIISSKQNFPFTLITQNQFCTTSKRHDVLPPTDRIETPSVLSPTSQQATASSARAQKIVRAMKAYLEKVVEYRDFMQVQVEEYEIGRRHLARMMGADPDNFGKEEIDAAIQYLLPSALYEKKARPIMRHPEEIFPKPKAAEFDYSGRPYSSLFYTRKPVYYQLLYDMTEKVHKLNAFQDDMYRKGVYVAPPESKIDFGPTQWISQRVLEDMLQENLNEEDYSTFLQAVTILSEHPYSNRERDFLMKYRIPMEQSTSLLTIPELMYEGDRPYMDAEGRRKTARAKVRVWGNGTGKITINGKNILYFDAIQDREQVLFPLQLTDMMDKVDVEATVSGGGVSGHSGAVRAGISFALMSFVSKECLEKMRIAGLLTLDWRTRERKKPGQKGARAKYTWKKR